MLTVRFHGLFDRLVAQFHTYHDITRSPGSVVELASARIALDDARTEIASERVLIAQHPASSRPVARTSVSAHDLSVLDVQGLISN